MSLTEHGLNLIFFLDATLHLASHMCAQAQQKLLLRPSQRKRQPLHMLDHLNLCRTAYAAKVEARACRRRTVPAATRPWGGQGSCQLCAGVNTDGSQDPIHVLLQLHHGLLEESFASVRPRKAPSRRSPPPPAPINPPSKLARTPLPLSMLGGKFALGPGIWRRSR